MAESGLDVGDLAQTAGVSRSNLDRVLKDPAASMVFDGLERVAAAAGLKLVVLPINTPHYPMRGFEVEIGQLKSLASGAGGDPEQSLCRWLSRRGMSGWEPLRISRRDQTERVVWTVIFKRYLRTEVPENAEGEQQPTDGS